MNSQSEYFELGYEFHPARSPQEHGHPQLDVILRDRPTGLHFDPEHLRIPVVMPHGDVQTLKISHPWNRSEGYPVYPGRMAMDDFQDRIAQAFSFGGQLSIEAGDEITVCRIHSPAPILNLTRNHPIAEMLTEEVEVLLAERRAAWLGREAEFESRLANLNPHMFYHACLNSLRERFKYLPPPGDNDFMQRFHHFVMVESKATPAMGDMIGHAQLLADLL